MTRSLKLAGIIVLLTGSMVFGQNDNDNTVLLTIDNNKITKGEFVRIYKKNNTKDAPVDNKSLNDYLELFINFKLKVLEAESLGLDTVKTFISELAGYRKQLATPYLIDKDVDDKLLKEAYERKKTALRASHILIKLNENSSPADTLTAYNKALDIRKKALAGEDFGKLAQENSDDETTKVSGGDISYFSALSTVYPFENAAYSLKTGDISMPVKSSFGYHLIKITDRIPNPGEVKVAHIMVIVPRDAKEEDVKKAETKINETYARLQNGEDFAKLATETSDDKSSAKKGGELPWFSVGRMVPEFELAAFALKTNGEYSKPVRTAFGWHILKRIDAKPLGTFEEVKSDLQTKIAKDSRAQQSRSSLVEKLKKEYNYKLNDKQLAEFNKVIDTNLYNGSWKAQNTAALTKPLFTLGDSVYSQKGFALYLEGSRKKPGNEKRSPEGLNEYLKQLYNRFVEEKVIAYEESRLDAKYPQFRYLMSEYHDGILLFDLTDKMVWSKAVKDSTGLADFYEKNKNQYMWDKRADITTFTYGTEKNKEDALKLIAKKAQKGYSNEDIVKSIAAKDSASLQITENKLFSQGDNATADKLAFGTTYSPDSYEINTEKHQIILINKIIEPKIKTLSEAKGLVTADYQTYLEKTWIESLRSKYKITVNKEVLSTIQ